MNINIYYKGETVALEVESELSIRRLYQLSLKKFRKHIDEDLLLSDIKLQLRLKRNNSILHFSDIAGHTLKDNDMIIIELKGTLTTNKRSKRSSKKHNLSQINNNYSPSSLKKLDLHHIENDVSKSNGVNQDSTDFQKESHGYQNVTESPALLKKSKKLRSQFSRSDLRRSLGADIAPQFEYHNLNKDDNPFIKYDSQSSLSDFSKLNKAAHRHHSQSIISEYEKQKFKSAPVSPMKSASFPRSNVSMLNSYNVRTIGNKINISIVKRPKIGLGFTIVTRDNQVLYGSAADIANSVVILVNKILPDGGAAENDKLRPGDRLLEVNGVPIKSLKEVTETLRAIPENEEVKLVISRVDKDGTPSNEYLLEINEQKLSMKEIIVEIRLNKSKKEKQQLGLNIISHGDNEDFPMGPGVYIHSILPNSLVSQQDALKVDDKLISINGHRLLDTNVKETISHLQKVIENEPVLRITVCRIIPIEAESHHNKISKNDLNEFNNKLSTDRKVKHSSDSHSKSRSSYYSSSESLSNNHEINGNISAFERESKGRRSMSDKRKAHEDASQYAFYKETRLTNINGKEERMYSTLPTSSHRKKMTNTQSSSLKNKVQVPIKPSQMKLLNTPKIQQEQTAKVTSETYRSYSLRNSPNKLNERDIPYSHNYLDQSSSSGPLPNFNRSMNNSFRKAVHKSLSDNEQTLSNLKFIEKVSPKPRSESKINQNSTENGNSTLISNQATAKFSRSHSAKTPDKKKKSFNIRDFLTFKPISTKKSDTFPLSKQSHPEKSEKTHKEKVHSFNPGELPVNSNDDQVILNSTKRVLEWRLKNDEVISKEKKIKEKKNKKTASDHGTIKSRIDVSPRSRTPVSKTIKSHNHVGYDTDPYESIEGVLSSPASYSLQKLSKSKLIHSNSHANFIPVSLKSNANSASSRHTRQTSASKKISLTSETNIKVSKAPIKDHKSQRELTSGPLSHVHKYRF